MGKTKNTKSFGVASKGCGKKPIYCDLHSTSVMFSLLFLSPVLAEGLTKETSQKTHTLPETITVTWHGPGKTLFLYQRRIVRFAPAVTFDGVRTPWRSSWCPCHLHSLGGTSHTTPWYTSMLVMFVGGKLHILYSISISTGWRLCTLAQNEKRSSKMTSSIEVVYSA